MTDKAKAAILGVVFLAASPVPLAIAAYLLTKKSSAKVTNAAIAAGLSYFVIGPVVYPAISKMLPTPQ